ncbi:hypothetical protein L873DRAFT_1796738 [Choiromyces venosus 120613-1]|uniref:Uncharacterized protein n=1 Tax=Choiromyces venosus 120613-1 TaxID=1336337 RepID=A0A3N4K8W4_9PEZI|nr:hypothetical protein L873DRAFT_1824518 [Choiromyces venosus 120613-1]RPB05898.1 hypothetical protein L873DRAFT_1796738 [Choiromyces venosus 120613-1]
MVDLKDSHGIMFEQLIHCLSFGVLYSTAGIFDSYLKLETIPDHMPSSVRWR